MEIRLWKELVSEFFFPGYPILNWGCSPHPYLLNISVGSTKHLDWIFVVNINTLAKY